MKKTLIIIAIVAFLVALLPIVGNKVIQKSIINHITLLESYGVDVESTLDEHGYLSTKKSYLLSVVDGDKFAYYLNGFLDKNALQYTGDMLDGIELGADLEYSNLPLSDSISLDVYPLSLSSKSMKLIKNIDSDFESQIKNLLQKKSILVHLNYSVANTDFNGYLKDIDETLSLKDGSVVSFKMIDLVYNGDGFLGHLESLNLVLGEFSLDILRGDEKFKLYLNNFLFFSTFENDTTYNYLLKLKNLNYLVKTQEYDDLNLTSSDIYFDFSSTTQGEKTDLSSKSSFGHLLAESNSTTINLNDFNYEVSLNGIDKDSYEKLSVLFSDVDYADTIGIKIQQEMLELLSQGIKIKIADFSLGTISTNNTQLIDAFTLKAEMEIEKNANMAKDITSFATLISKNITLDSKVSFSKDMFSIINQEFPLTLFVVPYAKKEKNKIVFEVEFKDEKLNVNGKVF